VLGLHRSRKPPDEMHPFGHGMELYFWGLVVAIALFGVGGGMSFYEGIRHIVHPSPSRVRGARGRHELDARPAQVAPPPAPRGDVPRRDPEQQGSVHLRGAARGQADHPAVQREIRSAMQRRASVREVRRILTMQLAPDEVLVNADVRFAPDLDARLLADEIRELEREIHQANPSVRKVFIEAVGAKALLVLLFFMHLIEHARIHAVVLIVSLLLVGTFIVLTAADVATRAPGGEIVATPD
jgi:hypothetical protein